MNIAIAGGGIGGLTLALALHQRGISCTVYEAAPQLRPLGVGVNLLPHSVKELAELGLQEALAATAIETASLTYYNKFGQTIWSEPRGLAAGYPVPQYSIHRGELHMILLDAVLRRLGPERVVLGHQLTGFVNSGQKVQAKFTRLLDHSAVTIEADALVAADGIHSAARKQMWPNEGAPRYGQRVLWRAITEGEPFGDGRSMFMAGHPDVKFVAYPISRKLAEQGRSRINWIAELSVPEMPTRTDWNREVDISVFAEPFDSWKWEWIDIPKLIRGASAVYEFPLVDRDPLPHWRQGRVTLLGDAAHPMYPIGSNGASQAILDVRALADSLAGKGKLEAALEAYEAERLPKTANIVLLNRQNGPEQVMAIAEQRAPQGFKHIHDVMPREELEGIAARYKQVAGFTKDQVKKA
ncbi:flavin-dependent oxidoreductase [Piscinibacter sp. HJYY11]|uniref:flavin-dependent oxidoreductase n=1 Tax=Piscinibacter sp. HJYY11 TaxID=2801333 RepID=UPI00191D6EA9|nr:flavin-dependent oxidoreductase [Piscinibacter sp. HJYY11]MBL0731055.1 flavin-dependent oxidoreductase [Piscinibacter sp. HJYY11]